MGYSIVTISREFGSAGRVVGEKLAEQLGYDFYDYEIVLKIAEETGIAKHLIEEYGEEFKVSKKKFFSLFDHNTGNEISDELYLVQRKVIAQIAQKGKCVIVGRCADYVLRDNPDTLHVFISADMDFKVKRFTELYGTSDHDVESQLLEKDRRRKAYYSYYTNRNWGEAKDYDICLDTSKFGVDRCVDIIADLVLE